MSIQCGSSGAKLFRDPSISCSEIRSKGRKSIHHTSAFVWVIAPADAIPLRCNHSTKHLQYEPRRREAIKFAPAKKIRDFRCPNPSPTSIFSKFSNFRNFGVIHHLAWHGIFFRFATAGRHTFTKRNSNILKLFGYKFFQGCILFGTENSTQTSKTYTLYKRIRVSNCPCWCNFSTV